MSGLGAVPVPVGQPRAAWGLHPLAAGQVTHAKTWKADKFCLLCLPREPAAGSFWNYQVENTCLGPKLFHKKVDLDDEGRNQ